MTTLQAIGIFLVGGGMLVMWTTFMPEKVRADGITWFVLGGTMSLIAYMIGRGL